MFSNLLLSLSVLLKFALIIMTFAVNWALKPIIYIYLSICLSIDLSIYLSVCLCLSVSVCLSIYLSLCLYIFISTDLYVFLSVHLSLDLSISLSLDLFISLSLYLSIGPSILFWTAYDFAFQSPSKHKLEAAKILTSFLSLVDRSLWQKKLYNNSMPNFTQYCDWSSLAFSEAQLLNTILESGREGKKDCDLSSFIH